ncbi:MAG: helix-turn-helix domain-containing protein [Streptomycetaceae bacterium]|nr:helix-turn-helix domain-containing protein [Streptomycetaceae bacterium]
MAVRNKATQPQSPSWLHGFLARQMRRYRELAGKTQTDLANAACVSLKHYCSFELGERMPSRDTVEVVDDALGARGALVAIRDEMVKSPHPGWFTRLLELERGATEIWQYEAQVVPGLLQTEDYARAVLEAAPRQRFTRTVDEDLAVRLSRQELLTAEDAPVFWIVLDEAVLMRSPEDPRVMADQLEHLIRLAKLPNLTLQVLPLVRGLHSMLSGPATLLKFGGFGSDDVLYVEPIDQGLLAYDPVTVRFITRRLDLLRTEALSRAETVNLMRAKLESM